jgi:hypothetical protein
VVRHVYLQSAKEVFTKRPRERILSPLVDWALPKIVSDRAERVVVAASANQALRQLLRLYLP